MSTTACDIDKKLCLTAAALGAITRKDLAAAFRRANPQTSFDIERAHKWLQGRARPREGRLYDDWALVLDIGRPGGWIADCDLGEFTDVLCRARSLDGDLLLRRARAFGGESSRGAPEKRDEGGAQDDELAGSYACYSHCWSPYLHGKIIRGAMSIRAAGRHERPGVTYSEMLPSGQVVVTEGAFSTLRHALHLDLREVGGRTAFLISLFAPTRPVSVLAGIMCGPTIMAPEAQPSMTRFAMVRAPEAAPGLVPSNAYLEPQASIAEDLGDVGVPVHDRAAVDRLLRAILHGSGGGGFDSVPVADYRALVALFDREWFMRFQAAG